MSNPFSIDNYSRPNLELPKGSLANRNDRTFERVLRGSSGRFTAAIGGAAMIVHKTTMPSMALFS